MLSQILHIASRQLCKSLTVFLGLALALSVEAGMQCNKVLQGQVGNRLISTTEISGSIENFFASIPAYWNAPPIRQTIRVGPAQFLKREVDGSWSSYQGQFISVTDHEIGILATVRFSNRKLAEYESRPTYFKIPRNSQDFANLIFQGQYIPSGFAINSKQRNDLIKRLKVGTTIQFNLFDSDGDSGVVTRFHIGTINKIEDKTIYMDYYEKGLKYNMNWTLDELSSDEIINIVILKE